MSEQAIRCRRQERETKPDEKKGWGDSGERESDEGGSALINA